MVAELPPPPVPADADLRHLDEMPLEVRRLRDSGIAGVSDAEAFRCGLLSWASGWHQLPAGSLPASDADLCRIVGLGRDLKTWRRIKEDAMRGWRQFADGRLYHIVLTEKVIAAWNSTLAYRWGKECDRIRKENRARIERKETPLELPPRPSPVPYVWPPDSAWNSCGKDENSAGSNGRIPPENRLKVREGKVLSKRSAAAASCSDTAPARAGGIPEERPASQAPMARQNLLEATFAMWLTAAHELGIGDPGFANGERRIAQGKILDEIPSIEVWQIALQKLREAEFLRHPDGRPKRFVNFAWFCDPEHFTGLLEDRYRDRDAERLTRGPSHSRSIYEGAMSMAGKQPLRGILDP